MVGTILGALFGLFLLFLVGQAFWKPLRILLYMGLRLILGCIFLVFVNFATGSLGFSLGVNPASAMTVGFLGLPGLLLLIALKAMTG